MRPLETERLLLRRLDQEDHGDIASWEAWANTQHGREIEAQKLLDFCFREYRESRMGPWGILLKDTRLLVGNCGLPHINLKESTGEINYYIAPRYRGQGLATEAVMALLKFGFGDMELNRIQGRCAPDNKSSERVMQKAGMKFDRMITPYAGSDDVSRQKLFAVMQGAYEPVSK
jgi:ribosomal-protein-alanine N-acetyltransferase